MEEDRYTRITLRLPKELHQRLSDDADRTSKSLNAEIVARLESSYLPSATEPVLREALAELAKHQRTAMASVALIRDMLANYVINLFRRLPKKDQANEDLRLMHNIALATIQADEQQLVEAATRKTAGIDGIDKMGDAASFFQAIARHNRVASELRHNPELRGKIEPDPYGGET